MPLTFRLAAALCGLTLTAAVSAAPHFDDIVVSDSADGDAVDSFDPGVAKIFLHAHMAEIPNGAKMKGTWIAVDTHGVAPANYPIDSAEMTASSSVNVVNYSLSKPNNGWPVGHYRVDLSIDGRSSASAEFDIAKD